MVSWPSAPREEDGSPRVRRGQWRRTRPGLRPRWSPREEARAGLHPGLPLTHPPGSREGQPLPVLNPEGGSTVAPGGAALWLAASLTLPAEPGVGGVPLSPSRAPAAFRIASLI